jgi:hypothetical protein
VLIAANASSSRAVLPFKDLPGDRQGESGEFDERSASRNVVVGLGCQKLISSTSARLRKANQSVSVTPTHSFIAMPPKKASTRAILVGVLPFPPAPAEPRARHRLARGIDDRARRLHLLTPSADAF